MKYRFVAWIMICAALLLSSCRPRATKEPALHGAPEVGALYSLSDGEGGYRIGRVVAADEEVIFVTLYAKRWTTRPTAAEAEKANLSSGVAYSPQTFAGMQPVHLNRGEVTAAESEAYEEWKRGQRETF